LTSVFPLKLLALENDESLPPSGVSLFKTDMQEPERKIYSKYQ
jgi:hypothetical protein